MICKYFQKIIVMLFHKQKPPIIYYYKAYLLFFVNICKSLFFLFLDKFKMLLRLTSQVDDVLPTQISETVGLQGCKDVGGAKPCRGRLDFSPLLNTFLWNPSHLLAAYVYSPVMWSLGCFIFYYLLLLILIFLLNFFFHPKQII